LGFGGGMFALLDGPFVKKATMNDMDALYVAPGEAC
jgi:hypothetical protein